MYVIHILTGIATYGAGAGFRFATRQGGIFELLVPCCTAAVSTLFPTLYVPCRAQVGIVTAPRRGMADLPAHTVVSMPALSPVRSVYLPKVAHAELDLHGAFADDGGRHGVLLGSFSGRYVCPW